jgi:excinuclease ABC subunit A
VNVIEMNFLPDVYVQCEVCKGARYNRETLQVKYKGHSIADVLNMTVEESLEVFKNIPRASTRLQTLVDVGTWIYPLRSNCTNSIRWCRRNG